VSTTLYADNRLDEATVIAPLKEVRGVKAGTLQRLRLHLQPVNREGALPVDGAQISRTGYTIPLNGRSGLHDGLDATGAGLAGGRDELPLILRATLQIDGADLVAQEFEVRSRHPLRVTLLPAVGATLPVRVENPTGAPFNGRIALKPKQNGAWIPLRFGAGEKERRVELLFPQGTTGEYTASCEIEEGRGGRVPPTVVMTTPAERFTPLESFGAYPSGEALPTTEFQIVPDGDPKVGSQITGTVVDAPSGLPGAGTHALRIAYDFGTGWKFLRLARGLNLPGRPIALGMWVYGDGSGDLLRARFTDTTGQTFQADGGTVDWKGWRYISFPLQGDTAGHWGGENDGTVHYPIHLDTALLVDSPGGRGGKGVLTVTDLTLISPGGKSLPKP
jgi:hypothetical protein